MQKKYLKKDQIKQIYRLSKDYNAVEIAKKMNMSYDTIYFALQQISRYWAPQNVKKAIRKNQYIFAIGELKSENMHNAVKKQQNGVKNGNGNGHTQAKILSEHKDIVSPLERLAAAMSTFQRELQTCVEDMVDQQVNQKTQEIQKENNDLKEQLKQQQKIVDVTKNSNWISNLKQRFTFGKNS